MVIFNITIILSNTHLFQNKTLVTIKVTRILHFSIKNLIVIEPLTFRLK